MFSQGYMTYFTVEQCGLYQYSKDECLALGLGETFDHILKWVDGRSLAATIPWDPTKTRDNKSRVYCKHLYKDPKTGHFLLVLWKSDQHSSGTMLGVEENETTGSKKIVKTSSNHKGKNVIWGRPCYYWIIPEYNTVVSIKFEHSLCDADLFREFVRCAITNRVKHDGRIKMSNDGHTVLTHSADKETKCLYRFNLKTKSLNSRGASFQKLVSRITHIVTRDTILVSGKDNRSHWVNDFNKLFPVAAKGSAGLKTKKIEVRSEAKPTPKEVKEIIEQYAKDQRKTSEWNNVGFVTDTGTFWVDKYRLREEIRIDGVADSYLPADMLYSSIAGNLNRYLNPLVKEKNQPPRRA
ncbi:hypothetical protein ACTNIE_002220 [Vibrio vulnificus]